MKSIKYLTIIGLTILMVSPTFAFNGKRKGLIFGAGLGYFDLPSEKSANSMTIHFKFGLGLSDKDVLSIEMAEYDRRTVELWFSSKTARVYDKKLRFLAWHHYLNSSTSTLFFGAGIGKFDSRSLSDPIWEPPHSIMISGGYEYRHFEGKLFALYLVGDKEHMDNYKQVNFGAMIGVAAF